MRGSLRRGKGRRDEAFFLHDLLRFHDTWTHPATGRSFTVSGSSNIRELQAIPLGDGVFGFEVPESDVPITWRDGDGEVVVRDRGTIRSTMVFDTLSDGAPGGDVLSFTIDRVSGPHPDCSSTNADRCALVHELLAE